MHYQFQFTVSEQTESSACVFLEFPTEAGNRSLTGKLIGPHCEYARTLPAEFSFVEFSPPDIEIFSDLNRPKYIAQVIDPCYWTPELPFLYDLQVSLQREDGKNVEYQAKVGLTRWECHWRNLRLESRRIVLRGSSIEQPTTDSIPIARAANTALIVDRYDRAFCDVADQVGVIVCLDLRTAGDSLSSILSQINSSTSVFLVLISSDQSRQKNPDDLWPTNCIVAEFLSTTSPEDYTDLGTVVAFELRGKERPPSWIAKAPRPVIVIRRGEDYADLVAARAACDRLQAELAPEFDLAGYFVAP